MKSPLRNEQTRLDLKEFWTRHDLALAQHESGGGAALSHDLYRGMPPWFNAYYAYFQRLAVERLLKRCDVPPGGRVLDVGCGTGRWSGLMLRRGLRPTGLDMGHLALQYAARQWPEARFCQAQLPDLCFAPGAFDLAISVTVLQHVPGERQAAAVSAIACALKSGGHLIVCETIDVGDPSPHIFGHRADEWLGLLHGAGLQPVAQAGCEYLPQVKVFQWGRRVWQMHAPSGSGAADVSAVAGVLKTRPLLGVPIRMALVVSYPIEYLAATLLPWRWAHLGCFLLRKP